MSRLSDPWALLFVAGALAVTAGGAPVPRVPPIDLHETLQRVAQEWQDEETQRAFATDCEHPVLRWYWVCDAAE